AGAAGNGGAEKLGREGYQGPITLITADEFLPYDRPNLSKDYLAGTAPEEWITLRSADFYKEQKIEALTNTSVIGIDAKSKHVTITNGRSLSYRELMLTNGCEPVQLKFAG